MGIFQGQVQETSIREKCLDFLFSVFLCCQLSVLVELILTQAKKPMFAIKIKSTTLVKNDDAYALREFKKEYPDVEAYILSPIDKPRLLEDEIQVFPWQLFFKKYQAFGT